MSLWHCTTCTTAYSVGAPRCPHCGATKYQEEPVPKVYADGPPSYAGHVDVSPADVPEPDFQPADEVKADEPVVSRETTPKPATRKTGKR